MCCDPFGLHPDRVVAADDTHHIYGLRQRPDLAYKEDCTAPVCTACHGKLNAMERKNEPTEQLFRAFQAKVRFIAV